MGAGGRSAQGRMEPGGGGASWREGGLVRRGDKVAGAQGVQCWGWRGGGCWVAKRDRGRGRTWPYTLLKPCLSWWRRSSISFLFRFKSARQSRRIPSLLLALPCTCCSSRLLFCRRKQNQTTEKTQLAGSRLTLSAATPGQLVGRLSVVEQAKWPTSIWRYSSMSSLQHG